MNRRSFLHSAALAAAALVADPERLVWIPDAKKIFIPDKPILYGKFPRMWINGVEVRDLKRIEFRDEFRSRINVTTADDWPNVKWMNGLRNPPRVSFEALNLEMAPLLFRESMPAVHTVSTRVLIPGVADASFEGFIRSGFMAYDNVSAGFEIEGA